MTAHAYPWDVSFDFMELFDEVAVDGDAHTIICWSYDAVMP